jgi:hypothetical protein
VLEAPSMVLQVVVVLPTLVVVLLPTVAVVESVPISGRMDYGVRARLAKKVLFCFI